MKLHLTQQEIQKPNVKDFLLEQIENSLKLGNDLEIYYS